MPPKKTCYACGAPKTSQEHVPPKCLFPEDSYGLLLLDEPEIALLTTPPIETNAAYIRTKNQLYYACKIQSKCSLIETTPEIRTTFDHAMQPNLQFRRLNPQELETIRLITGHIPKGSTLRNNLITVPSCDKHNQVKSGDDEYLDQAIRLGGYWNNEHSRADYQIGGRLDRAIVRKPKLFGSLWQTRSPVFVDDTLTSSIEIDPSRFGSSIELIIKGLYFYNFKQICPHTINICSPSLITSSNSEDAKKMEETNLAISKSIYNYLSDQTYAGENPAIFKYKMKASSGGDTPELIAELVFYEGFRVFGFVFLKAFPQNNA